MEINWISVDDDLPKDLVEVLVCGTGIDDKKKLAFAHFNRKGGWSVQRYDLDKVFYWAECQIDLPEFDIEPYLDHIDYGIPQKLMDA